MTNVRRLRQSYRVLCQIRYTKRGSSDVFCSWFMVEAPSAFFLRSAVAHRAQREGMHKYRLLSYLPESGGPAF